ncbi:pyridoxal phosphate-dependent aminotransferase [Methanobacterium sp. CWC-01]|jgi:aspartate/methionine/tyrosine aminotransferase|uniref:pyridoxal phosphate-dependent aminotransferase n=1 Tax=Methanobacterium aridiramus TaxID=2584467 RepID=UPI002576B42E|nr:pyridoxal phosphate-dependent aminotransferase [Methanobacterium sp. CWC-01]WJI10009.1 pyridoxal phosphate-dependent aminotransferase [Methanobacterium sp. CWC-01]
MISPKKYAKSAKALPKGFHSANEFFNYVYNDQDMIWMGQNTNHLHEEDGIMEAMLGSIKKKDYCKYPPPEGFPELKDLVQEDLGLTHGFDILITAGGTESLYLCTNNILEPENNTITCDPGYLIIDNFASRFGDHVKSIPIYNPECHYKLTPQLVRENMDQDTKLVSLVDPLNPLGSSYTKEELKDFADLAEDHDIYLLHDITYRDFARNHHLMANYAPEHTITVYSFSKIYGMAGLRVGAVLGTPEMIDSLRTIVINDLGTNVVAQKGAIAAVNSKYEWLDRIKDTTRSNQDIIKEAVDLVDGCFIPVYPSDGNMLVIDMYEAGVKPHDLVDYLLEKKIFAREGSYTSKLFGHRYLRVSFSIPKHEVEYFADCFLEGMDELTGNE